MVIAIISNIQNIVKHAEKLKNRSSLYRAILSLSGRGNIKMSRIIICGKCNKDIVIDPMFPKTKNQIIDWFLDHKNCLREDGKSYVFEAQ